MYCLLGLHKNLTEQLTKTVNAISILECFIVLCCDRSDFSYPKPNHSVALVACGGMAFVGIFLLLQQVRHCSTSNISLQFFHAVLQFFSVTILSQDRLHCRCVTLIANFCTTYITILLQGKFHKGWATSVCVFSSKCEFMQI